MRARVEGWEASSSPCPCRSSARPRSRGRKRRRAHLPGQNTGRIWPWDEKKIEGVLFREKTNGALFLFYYLPEIRFDGESELGIDEHLEVGQLCPDVIRDRRQQGRVQLVQINVVFRIGRQTPAGKKGRKKITSFYFSYFSPFPPDGTLSLIIILPWCN